MTFKGIIGLVRGDMFYGADTQTVYFILENDVFHEELSFIICQVPGVSEGFLRVETGKSYIELTKEHHIEMPTELGPHETRLFNARNKIQKFLKNFIDPKIWKPTTGVEK